MNTKKTNEGDIVTGLAFTEEVKLEEFTKRECAALTTLPKTKHNEHLAGVLALHRALSGLYPGISGIEVVRQRNAPPAVFINGEVLSSVAVSVSHSKGRALAAAGKSARSIGVDIESCAAFNLTPLQFYSQEELNLGAYTNPVLVWAYKEALLKALHVGLRIHPKRVHLTLNECGALLGAHIDNIPIAVSGKELDRVPGYVTVLTVLHEESAEAPLRTREKELK